MEKIIVANVVRISGGGVTAATFRHYSTGMAGWARQNGHDRLDHLVEPFHHEQPTVEEIIDILGRTIQRFPGSPDKGNLVVGLPGPIEKRHLLFCPSIPGLPEILPRMLERWEDRFRQVILANNTDLLAEAEALQGSLRVKGLRLAIVISLGRGIGSALIRNGQVDLGIEGSGGEIGHTIVDPDGSLCECGQRGCLEQYVSGPALQRIAEERGIHVGEPSELANVLEAEPIINAAREILVESLAFALILVREKVVVLSGRLTGLYDCQKMQKLLNDRIPPFLRNNRGVIVLPGHFTPAEGALIGGGHVGLRLQGAAPFDLATAE